MNVKAYFTGDPKAGETFKNKAALNVNKTPADNTDGPDVEIEDPNNPDSFIKEVSLDDGKNYKRKNQAHDDDIRKIHIQYIRGHNNLPI
jgi:hypothetical protein